MQHSFKNETCCNIATKRFFPSWYHGNQETGTRKQKQIELKKGNNGRETIKKENTIIIEKTLAIVLL